MKVVFTVLSPAPFTFTADLNSDADAWRLLGILAEGQNYPVTHEVVRLEPDVPGILKPQALDYDPAEPDPVNLDRDFPIPPTSSVYTDDKGRPYQPEPDAPWPIGPTLEDM